MFFFLNGGRLPSLRGANGFLRRKRARKAHIPCRADDVAGEDAAAKISYR